jgi:hypothetical protein
MIKQKIHNVMIAGGIAYIATCSIMMIWTWFIAYFDADNVIPVRINSIGERDFELGIHITGIIMAIYLCYSTYKYIYANYHVNVSKSKNMMKCEGE